MRKRDILGLAARAFALAALSGCADASAPPDRVQLEVAGPPVDPGQSVFGDIYRMPVRTSEGFDGGTFAQRWAMLGREDRAAASASGSAEYTPEKCDAIPGSPFGWDAVTDALATRAADHRVLIINESHHVTRHRETTRWLLAKLRPLGFSVLAAETFNHGLDGTSPVEQQPPPAWPRMNDGYYSREPAFGRLVRQARALGYRLAAYEEIYDGSQPPPNGPLESIARREAAQARHLAEIFRGMGPDERLIVHVGYGHGSEVPANLEWGEVELMGLRFKALTGIDPLTITQTTCRQQDGPAFLAQPPASVRPGHDMIVSHPVESFVDHRPRWRREAGDIPTAIPASLRPTDEPLVIEAFAWNEPFDAVPVDRIFVQPGEDLPLLLPPGRYRVRAVRLAER